MKKVKVEEAIGSILATDVTIIEGTKKGVLFKRGHVIEDFDVPKLLSIGRHYVWIEDSSGLVHENDAGTFLMEKLMGEYLTLSEPEESKVKLFAKTPGVVKINKSGLLKINEIDGVVVATKRDLTFVGENAVVAIGKVMDKEVERALLNRVEKISYEYHPIITLLPIKRHKIALFPVGNEFLEGRREETLSLRVLEYLEGLNQEVVERKILPDDEFKIKEEGLKAIENGANVVIFMGGMAIDPDDRTVEGIKLMGTEVVRYGVPMFPGFTFLVGYLKGVPVLGIPSSSGISKDKTSFHTLMPVILSDYKLSKEDITLLSEGGLLI